MAIKKMSNEHKLILLTARLNTNSHIQQKIKKLLNNPIDWHKIINISNQHQILPFLYYNLNRLKFSNNILQDIFAEMKNCYYSNLNKNLILENEISLILELTNREGVSIIPFKGFALLQTLYHNHGLRIMVDVDILTKEKDFQKVKDILKQLGYHEKIEELTPEECCQKYQYVAVFSKTFLPNQSLFIEIHRTIALPRPYKLNIPHLWQRTQEKTINSQKLLCLSSEDTFLSLSLHLRRHTRRLPLKSIVDIAGFLNANGKMLNWPYIIKSSKDNRIVTTVFFSLYIAKELFEAPIAPDILNNFCPNIIKRNLMSHMINKYNFFTLKKWRGILLRILLFDSPTDFLLYLWRVTLLERFADKKIAKLTSETAKK